MKPEEQIARLFEQYVKSGEYQKKLQRDYFLKQAKDHCMKELRHSEEKRHEFAELNMVAKFVNKKSWEIDHQGLIEELFCYVKPEVVLPMITLNAKRISDCQLTDVLSGFLEEQTSYVKPTLNKFGKRFARKTDILFGGQSILELVQEIKEEQVRFKKDTEFYKQLKEEISHQFTLIKQSKVKTDLGSVSQIKNQPSWDLAAVLDAYDEDFLIEYGEVQVSKMDEYILKGLVPGSLLSKHRELKDIRLDFMVMDIEAERRAIEIHQRIKNQYIEQRITG